MYPPTVSSDWKTYQLTLASSAATDSEPPERMLGGNPTGLEYRSARTHVDPIAKQ